MLQIIFGTSNPKKVADIQALPANGFEVLTLEDIGVTAPEVEENGATFEANARIKYDAIRPLVPDEYLLATEDSGLEIHALNNEPGVYSRRWNPERREMTDEELIDKTIRELTNKPDRSARFVSAIAFGGSGISSQTIRGELAGEITEQPDEENRIPGMPYRAVFYVSVANLMMQELIDTPYEQRQPQLTHREKAWLDMLRRISSELR